MSSTSDLFTTYIFGRREFGARGRASERASDFVREMTSGMSHEERLAQAKWLAQAMDSNFRVPGTPLRFGWDSLLGLVPGLGDLLTSAISLIILRHAWETRAPLHVLARMTGNIAIDFALGIVPVVGDLSDFVFKANRKNAALLERHLTKQVENRRMVQAHAPRS